MNAEICVNMDANMDGERILGEFQQFIYPFHRKLCESQ